MSGSAENFTVVKDGEINELRKLLELAKCPDENCDGKGTCAALGPGYDGESDVDFWECRWCFERALVLNRNDT